MTGKPTDKCQWCGDALYCLGKLHHMAGFTKTLGGEWLLSCGKCCEESGGSVREIGPDGQPGEARF